MKKIYKFIIINLVLIIILFIAVTLYGNLSPKINIKDTNNIILYDNKELPYFTSKNGYYVKLNDISKNLINATIASEDKNFYKHHGFDYPRILVALKNNILHRNLNEGASTISQQYVKNLFLDFDKTFKRKLDEALYTIRLEAKYSKDEILEGYLNTINYGHGIYGVGGACKYYFNKDCKNLSLSEATTISSIPKSPSNYNPIDNYDNNRKRKSIILNLMVKDKMISLNDKERAEKDSVNLVGKKGENDERYLYYKDTVLKEFKDIPDISHDFNNLGMLKIYTYLDKDSQDSLINNINNELKNDRELQVASVMLDPSNGSVLALVGGRSYNKSEYNRAVSSKRQVGSTMKPYLYYAALENGFTTSSQFISEKTKFNLDNNNIYEVHNYNDKYANRPISMAAAVSYSDNIYAVKTNMFLGSDALINVANRVGITSSLRACPSLPLGTSEINIMEMAGGYAAFANLGYKVKPHLIKKIVDRRGHIIYQNNDIKTLTLNSNLTFILNNMLTSTYDKNFIDYNVPTALGLSTKLKHTYALKSGTTDTDEWYIGYNKKAVLAVWLGYDNNKEIGKIALNAQNIWYKTIENYEKNMKDVWYKAPKSLSPVFVDPISGNPINDDREKKKLMYFVKGSEPNNTIQVFDEKMNN